VLDHLFATPHIRRRMRAGPLGACADPFLLELKGRGYKNTTLCSKARCVAAFGAWMEARGYGVGSLDEGLAARFLKQRRQHGLQADDRGTLRLLLDHTRGIRFVRPQRSKQPVDRRSDLVYSFERHLLSDRGCSQWTARIYTRIAHEFLSDCFRGRAVDPSKLAASDIPRWILRRVRGIGSASAKQTVTALRAFLRYLRFSGHLRHDLAACVPKVPAWRLTSLPGSLEPQELEHLIRTSRIHNALGYRDSAILLLLARLGLRASEVAALTLDDIEWDAGEIAVRGKGNRVDRMPIPPDVGKALADYLRNGRPPGATTRTLFVRAVAPHVGFSCSSPVAILVRKALLRAGLNPPRKGAHLLRHTAATELLRKGASLIEIGDVLRHGDVDTTAIYAKVDLDRLRQLAQPWLGGSR
jgi:integrase/recombinase XerD